MTMTPTSKTPQIGDLAPDVVLASADDLSRRIRVSDYRGRRLLIFMWASW